MMPTMGKVFGERIRELRRERLLTQEDLAEKSGLNANSIVRIENGTIKEPRFSTVRKLAAALGVDPMDLPKVED
jgi:transcriptional regulator with XRE-family HTH domain